MSCPPHSARPLSRRGPRARFSLIKEKKTGGGVQSIGPSLAAAVDAWARTERRMGRPVEGAGVGPGFERAGPARSKEEAYPPESHGDWRHPPVLLPRIPRGGRGSDWSAMGGASGRRKNKFEIGSKTQWLQAASSLGYDDDKAAMAGLD